MGSIFRYSGLTTKIRAMRASLVTREQYMKMAELKSVSELVEMLKKTKGYGEIFGGVEAQEIHRGDMEKLMICSKYRDFEKMYRFASIDQRQYMKLYFIKYEIDILKKAITHVDSIENRDIFAGFDQMFKKYPDIDIAKVCEATTIDEIIEASRGTIFYETLAMVRAFPEPTEFDYEIALDLFFFGYVWRKRKRLFKGDELKSVSMNFGTEADTLNIMWIHRTKRYYRLSAGEVYSMVIPVYYKLRKSQIKALVESEDEAAFFQVLSSTVYGKNLDESVLKRGNIGKIFEDNLTKCYQKLFKMDPYSLSAINAYLKDKENEIKKLVTIAECIRYQYSVDEILKQI